jgi:alpha-2-macroglobulin
MTPLISTIVASDVSSGNPSGHRVVEALMRRLVCTLAAALIATNGCRAPASRTPTSSTPAHPAHAGVGRPTVPIDAKSDAGVLVVRAPEASAKNPNAVASPLAARDAAALLAHLEPLPDVTRVNAVAPSLRPPSAPPPRPGATHAIAFVVPSGKQLSDAPIKPGARPVAPLASPQILPRGEIPAESEIRVRFDEPMVPVAAVGKTATPAVTIAPAVAGTWRWLDTRVLVFTARAARLPGATEFTVTVPAGVRAVSGATLAQPVAEKFSTPALQIAGVYPSALRPDGAIAVQLDQDFDPVKIAPLLRAQVGKTTLPVRVIDLTEARARWAKNPSFEFDQRELGARYVLLAPATAWPAGADVAIALAKNAPSREGPRVSERETAARAEVVPAFAARGLFCYSSEDPVAAGARCPAKSWMSLSFSNPVEPATYRAQKVQIEGEPFEDHALEGNSVTLWAPAAVGRGYSVAIGDGLVDIYGQPFTGAHRVPFVTTPPIYLETVDAPTGLIVLDPRFQIPQWVLTAEAVPSVRVQLYQVEPADYFAYLAYEGHDRAVPPGRRVYDKTFAIGKKFGAHLRVDLRPGLSAGGTGHVIAVATTGDHRYTAWLQVTRLGISARLDGEQLSGWVNDITPSHFLQPIGGVATQLVIDQRKDAPAATSDAHGHVAFALPEARKPARAAILVARTASDSTFTALDGRYEHAIRTHDARWYVTDDRFTYKPGEQVYVKGWVRWTHSGPNPDLELPRPGDTVAWALVDARRNKLAGGTADVTDQGGFDVTVKLPPNANLGTATFTFTSRGTSITHPIAIEEFRTPAYAVTLDDDVTHSGAVPLVLGESIEMRAAARYYAGGGLEGANIMWDARLAPTVFSPPGWDEFAFVPERKRSDRTGWRSRKEVEVHSTGTLAAASTSDIAFGIAALANHEPAILSVDATVSDVDRMYIRASSRPILVHPSAYYVGLRLAPGTGNTLEAIVTDVDGNAVTGVPIAVDVEGVLWSERERDDAVVRDAQHCKLVSAATPVTCSFTSKDFDTAYTATARIADPRGRANTSRYDVPWWSRKRDRDLSIEADRASYRPGDVAKLTITSKIVPATAVVTFARQGVIAQRRVELTREVTPLDVPIEPAYLTNLHLDVDRLATARNPRDEDAGPVAEHSETSIELAVDVESARLVMTTRALRPLVEPGEEATFEVDVRHAGKPVANAEVALLVVDEAVLALSHENHKDPLAPFYRRVDDGTSQVSSIDLVHDSGGDLAGAPGFARYELSDEGEAGGTFGGALGGEGFGTVGYGAGGGGLGFIMSRKDFRANAAFSPRLHTDARGKVRLTVKMPDSLTRYRVVALATAETRYFGKAESTIVAQRIISARTVAPRFLTQGDAFALPVLVQNLDGVPRTIDVAVRAANLASIGPTAKRVTIPAGQRAEVRFDFATRTKGKAVVQTIVTSQRFADASQVELPVYEPATTESFATYGTVDDAPQLEQLAVPADIFRDVGGVEVELASTQLQSLTDAFWYLYAYPYECAEQRSSRMLATSAVFDILDAFATPGRPTKKEIEAMRANDLRILARDQNRDGGWGYFNGLGSDPYVTMQVLSAFAAAKVKNTGAIAFVTKLVAGQLAALDKEAALPVAERRDRPLDGYVVALAAAGLSALGAAGADVRDRALRLHARAVALDAYPVDAKARVLALLATQPAAAAVRKQLVAQLLAIVHETAASASATASYVEAERLLLVSSTKTSALVLDALIREVPAQPLIAKLARGVLDGRRNGRWLSTQENLVALQALRRYFDTYEKATPNYVGRLWFGTAGYAEQAFVGRSSARASAALDWLQLPPRSTHDLALAKDGPGRMYYRVGITYAPLQRDLPALDNGFVVRRSYTAIDDPGDVARGADGRVHIKLGARVQVTIEALATTKRYQVAVVDPVPAGLEPVNERLATAERAAPAADANAWDHIAMRDNRSEAFALELAEGSHRFSYTARATTPGTFFAAPSKAEEMYSPETFGRSTGQVVVIE